MTITSPETLVAIIVAARRAGDRVLERQAKTTLKEHFGISLSFARPKPEGCKHV